MQLPSTVQLPRRTFQIPANHIRVANSVQTALWHCVYTAKYIYIYTYIFWILLACYYVDVYSKDVKTCILQYQCKPVCNKMTSKHTFILYHKTKTTTTNNIEIIRKSFKLTWHHSLFHSSRLWCDPLCHLHKCNKQLVQRSHSSTNLPSPWDVKKLRRACEYPMD